MAHYDDVKEAADAIRSWAPGFPRAAVVLGSGLGAFADALTASTMVPYGRIPHWPSSSVAGHDGRLVVGTVRGRSVAVLSGRSHLYEGQSPQVVTFGVRVLGVLGVKTLILTNAAGGVNTALTPGALMVVDDHVNLTGCNPLAGANDERFGPRFPDMSEVYSSRLRAFADASARSGGVALHHGVYAAVLGPSYETPAEIRYLRTIGADAVGMSTVPEALIARHMGIEVLAISCITNMAAGVLAEPLMHDDVVATAGRAASAMIQVLEGVLDRL